MSSTQSDERQVCLQVQEGLRALLEEAIAATKVLGVHHEHFKGLREKATRGELTVGVIGITSSGKSAFLNALMGEAQVFLPEESRATTNLLVKCRRGPKREVVLKFRTGQVVQLSGAELNPQRMAELCSEKLNPGNKHGLSSIEWTTRESLIPEGMVVVDTPGLDAYGCEGHEELTLRQFLPMADIIIYLSSIRNPFKQADLKGIGTVMDNDQRVLFVLSQSDVEKASTEAGKVWKSKEEKLQRHLFRLREDVRAIKGLHTFGTVLVSSKLAKNGFRDHASEAWKESGFDGVIGYLEGFADQLNHLNLVEAFSRRIDKELQSAIQTGTSNMDKASVSLEPLSSTMDTCKSQLLAQTLKKLRADLAAAITSELTNFDPMQDGQHAERELKKAHNREQLQRCFDDEAHHWRMRINALNEVLDPLQQELRATMKELDVEHDRAGTAQRALSSAAPMSNGFIKTLEREVKVSGWFQSWWIIPQYELQTYEEVDHTAALAALKTFAAGQSQAGRNHITWWERQMASVYLKPLEEAIKREQAGEAERSRKRSLSRQQVEEIRAAVDRLKDLLQKTAHFRQLASKAAPEVFQASVHEAMAPLNIKPVPQNALAALGKVLLAARECHFQGAFRKALAEVVPNRPVQKVLLLGPRRAQHLHLLALLGHSLDVQSYLEGIPSDRWLVAGSGPGFEAPVPLCPVPSLEGSTLKGMTLLIAPEDERLSGQLAWGDILGWADVIAVELNAPRISAGLMDLHRAPYRPELALHGERLLYTCGDGALLSDRMGDLFDIIKEARKTFFGQRPWFIYEDYEWRYTTLSRLLGKLTPGADVGRELLRRWSKEERLAMSPPFTREALQEVFLNI